MVKIVCFVNLDFTLACYESRLHVSLEETTLIISASGMVLLSDSARDIMRAESKSMFLARGYFLPATPTNARIGHSRQTYRQTF